MQACDAATGTCVVDMCAGVSCMEGTICNAVTGGCERDPCLLLRCPAGDRCLAGECARIPVAPDGGMPPMRDLGGSADGGEEIVRVLASGGGGCVCGVGSGTGASGNGWLTSILALALGLTLARRRGRHAVTR